MEDYGRFQCEFRINGTQCVGQAYVTPKTSVIGREWLEMCDSTRQNLEILCDGSVHTVQSMESIPEREGGKGESHKTHSNMDKVIHHQTVKQLKRVPRPREYTCGDSVWVKM